MTQKCPFSHWRDYIRKIVKTETELKRDENFWDVSHSMEGEKKGICSECHKQFYNHFRFMSLWHVALHCCLSVTLFDLELTIILEKKLFKQFLPWFILWNIFQPKLGSELFQKSRNETFRFQESNGEKLENASSESCVAQVVLDSKHFTRSTPNKSHLLES